MDIGTKFDDYIIKEKLGEGGFGQVYKIYNETTNEYKAIKIINYTKDKKNHSHLEKSLLNELKFYKLMCNSKGIINASLYKIKGKPCILMDLLNDSLDKLDLTHNIKKITFLTIRIINVLKNIHNNGFIHRDIKPSNFAFDNNDNFFNAKLFCIDFGICKKYIKHNEHIPFKKNKKFCGTQTYASISAHEKVEQSRKDDLESCAYMFIHLFHGKLPWEIKIKNESKDEKNIRILKSKKNISEIELCKDMPDEFSIFLKYVKNMDFIEAPPYNSFLNMFYELYKKL